MPALKLDAEQGWRWLAEGYAIYRSNPGQLSLLVLAYWILLLLLNVLPLLGPLVASLTLPALSVGLMLGARNIDSDQPAPIALLIEPLRQRPQPLFTLGAIYLLCTIGALGLSALADGGTLFRVMMLGLPLEERMLDNQFLVATQIVLLTMLPVVMANWYAPVLVAWHQLSVPKAMVFSFVACLRNWKPFLTYGITLLISAIFGPGLLLGVVAATAPALSSFFSALILVPLILILAPTIFASFYVSYRNVFTISEDA
jgi:hypothetical protein